MVKKRIKTRSAKNKGALFQKEIAQRISDLLGIPIEKDGDLESRQMGMSGTDIILRGKAKKGFNYSVECKRCESLSIPAWIRQAESNLGDFKNWLLFFRRSNETAKVVMEADHFFELLKQIKDK
jgi:hypothetical protein